MKKALLILVLMLGCTALAAEEISIELEDSVRTRDIDEVVVVSSSKENTKLRRQPVAVSLLGADDLEQRGIKSVKGASAIVPNFYMPDYGSRLTSAVYIRGIGSRMNTPAVGLYVDGVPCIDKSGYDFRFLDVERVDVLRGPQSTLYGRNAMGGLIRIHTADPLKHEGTDVKVGAYTRGGGASAAFATYVKPSSRMAFSIGGYGESREGFFKNSHTGETADGSNGAGAKFRLAYLPTDALRIDLTASYEHSDEDACPYFYEGSTSGTELYPAAVGRITSNRPSTYRRDLLNTGLNLRWTMPKFTLTSTTGYQHLGDRLFMDQDFISADIFTLTQKQRMNTISEELTLAGKLGKHWEWTTGAFVAHQALSTSCPIDFYADGVAFLNGQFAGIFSGNQGMPPMSLRLTGEGLPFRSEMHTPSTNAALFHQSGIKDLFVEGLSLTLGLRVDYDHRKLQLKSWTASPVDYNFSMPMARVDADMQAEPKQSGTTNEHSFQFLPKVALQYELPESLGNIYATAAKGYRSGGYNIQQYGELSQTLLRREMMLQVRDLAQQTIGGMGMPPAAVNGMLAAIDRYVPASPDIATLEYEPEESWNYELGAHFDLCNRHLRADVALFCTTTKNQQIARFAATGMGREMVNAGKSRSLGAEISLRAFALQEKLTISANYGFTDAVFTDYDLGTSNGTEVDYSGNRVPFVPRHTLGAAVDFRQPLKCGLLSGVTIGADVQGAGSICWDEANSFSQKFYAVLGAHAGLEVSNILNLSVWAKNLTNCKYDTFRFDSMNRRYAQHGVPFHVGFDVSMHF